MVYVYDIETFPNFFSFACENYYNNEKRFFILYEDANYNQINELRDFIKNVTYLIGYNNAEFDNFIVNYILENDVTTIEIYQIAQKLIKELYDYNDVFYKKYKYPKKYKSIDLMTLHASKALRTSLKEISVSINFPIIQDLPFHHNSFIKLEEINIIKKYNFNDVSITKKLAIMKYDDIKLRISIEKEYGINCLSKDPVTTGVTLLSKLYENEVGNNEFKQLRTYRNSIKLSDIIEPIVKFESKIFKDFLEKLKFITIKDTKGSLDYSILYGEVLHVFGTGGIHSKDKSKIIKPKDNELYIDADVSSLYPSIWIQYGYCPAHLDKNVFVPLYKNIRDNRVKAKKEGNKLIAETYKLVLNGAYGNTNNSYSWLYDPLVAMSITLNGQLFLSMLSEKLTNNGIKVDSINTDGITCLVPKHLEKTYYDICKWWESYTKLELEFANYQATYRRDVNNYISVYTNGKTKEKGIFIQEAVLGKGFDKPVIAKALWNYFVKNIPIETFIKNHNNIYDFCMMQKVNSKFTTVWNNQILQKTNRFYAGKGSESAYIYKIEGEKKHHILKNSGVILFNNFVKKDNYNINYNYYINEANKIKNLIEPNQLSLFE